LDPQTYGPAHLNIIRHGARNLPRAQAQLPRCPLNDLCPSAQVEKRLTPSARVLFWSQQVTQGNNPW
jgi:hypothetical protein